MIIRHLYIVVLLIISFTSFLAAQEPKIPDGAWEQHQEGVALALALTNGRGTDEHSIYLVLYIKNTSQTAVGLVNPGAGPIFFYLDRKGKPITVGHHGHPDQPWKDIEANFQRLRIVLPGKMIRTGATVTVAEADLLRSRKINVQCKIALENMTTGDGMTVVGSPGLQ